MDNERCTKTIRILSYDMRMNPVRSGLIPNSEVIVKATSGGNSAVLSTQLRKVELPLSDMVYSIHVICPVLKDAMCMKRDRFSIVEIIDDMDDHPISLVDLDYWRWELAIHGQNRP